MFLTACVREGTFLIVLLVKPPASHDGQSGVHEAVEKVASGLDIDVSPLREAAAHTSQVLARLQEGIRKSFPPDSYEGLDVVLCGSFGRGEVTRSSDCDYLILVHGDLDDAGVIPRLSKHLATAVREEQLEPPGSQGLFGDFAVSTEMFGRIGLESDTYLNTTRRMLLLTESVSAYQPHVREAALDTLIRRYCEDYRDRGTTGPLPVPRFLLNDLLRYWRTLAVDYGAKQWRAGVQRDELRYAKLRASRKVLFAGSLAALLQAKRTQANGTPVIDALYDHLKGSFAAPPLARLMILYDVVEADGRAALGAILKNYGAFLSIVGSETKRGVLKSGSGSELQALTDELENIGDAIDSALVSVFFHDPYLRDLTQQYGLF